MAKAVLGTVAGVIVNKVQKKEPSPPPPAPEATKLTTIPPAEATPQHKATIICGDSVAPVPFTV